MLIKSGFVNVIKPTGVSSSNVVCRVKKILGTSKVGHLGTLDPAASGVLPVAFGKATKFFDYFLKKDKEYVADVLFGIETDTLDSFGNITKTESVNIRKEDIEKVLPNFIGKINQVPPMYSAIKVDGKKACDLAREGKVIDLKSREIEIFSIDILSEIGGNKFRFKVHCSAGTYIRTLFNDIAGELGTVATTPVIIRTKSGAFDIENALTLDELEENKSVISIENLFSNSEFIDITDEVLVKKLLCGVKLKQTEIGIKLEGNFFLKTNNQLIGMYHFDGENLICDVFLFE